MRLLLAEDDELLGQATAKALMQLGYAVDWLTSGLRVAQAVKTYNYDCILLDLGLPDVSGERCIQALRKVRLTTPVIVLTARESVGSKVELLSLGADDYLVKPIDVDELAARIRAVIRRLAGHRPAEDAELVHGQLCINSASRTVAMAGKVLHLSNKEFWLLEILARNRGRIVTRQALEEALYGWDDECFSNAIDVFIYQLRKKLNARVIRTVRGVGYRLASPEEMDGAEDSNDAR